MRQKKLSTSLCRPAPSAAHRIRLESEEDNGEFNFVQTKDENGVKRLYLTRDRNIAGERFLVDKDLIELVRNATTESGETDTAKWMTGAEKERK